LDGCFKALAKISRRDYFSESTKSILKLFLERPAKTNRANVDPFEDSKIALKAVLDSI